MIDRIDVRVWWADFYEGWSRRAICPMFDHKWTPKMRGHVCARCRIWTAN